MKTFQISPIPALLPFVDRIWGWENVDGKRVQLPTLFPGTGAELYLHYAQPFQYITKESQTISCPFGHVILLRRHTVHLLPSSDLSFIAVRFKTGMFHRFTKIPANELIDQVLSVESIWGTSGARLLLDLSPEVALCERISRLQSHLLAHLESTSNDPLVEKAVAIIYRNFSSISIDGLAGSLNLSRRQFERRFSNFTGNTPSELKGLGRFQHTIRKLMLDASESPRDIALSYGYYDQAHFIHDFRRRTSFSPEQYLREARAKTHFYNTSRQANGILSSPNTGH